MKGSHFLLTDWKLDPDIRNWDVSLFSTLYYDRQPLFEFMALAALSRINEVS
jgi:hypothetical protein